MPRRDNVRYGWEHPAPPSWSQFAIWAVIGPLIPAGVLAAFTPLIVVTMPIAVLLILALGSRGGMNASAFGALSGIGVAPILVGCLNVDDPSFSSLPWFAIGLVFFAGGIAGYLAVTNASPRRP